MAGSHSYTCFIAVLASASVEAGPPGPRQGPLCRSVPVAFYRALFPDGIRDNPHPRELASRFTTEGLQPGPRQELIAHWAGRGAGIQNREARHGEVAPQIPTQPGPLKGQQPECRVRDQPLSLSVSRSRSSGPEKEWKRLGGGRAVEGGLRVLQIPQGLCWAHGTHVHGCPPCKGQGHGRRRGRRASACETSCVKPTLGEGVAQSSELSLGAT